MYKALSTDCIGFALPLTEVARTISAQGYDGFWFNFERDLEISPAETNDILVRNSLRPAGFQMPVNLRKDRATFDEDVRKLPDVAAYAREIGLDRCITAIAPGSDERDYAENFEHHRAMLAEVAGVLDDYGIMIGLEFVGTPEKRRTRRFEFIHTLDQMLELCTAVGVDRCGLVLDIWHWEMAGQSITDFRKVAAPVRIAVVHINDAPGGKRPEEQVDAERCLPGETGVLDIDSFFREITALNYDGPVVVEPFDATLPTLPFAQASQCVMDSIARVWPRRET